MILWNGSERVEAEITTAHSASSYGIPVLVVDHVAYGTFDAAGWYIVAADAEERAELDRGGYDLPGVLTLARDLGLEGADLIAVLGREPTAEEQRAFEAGRQYIR